MHLQNRLDVFSIFQDVVEMIVWNTEYGLLKTNKKWLHDYKYYR